MKRVVKGIFKNEIAFVILLGTVLIVIGVFLILALTKREIKVELKGNPTIQTSVKKEYVDEGYYITVNGKEVPKEKYTMTVANNVNPEILGEYTVIYNITYEKENYTLRRAVVVVDDVKPEITTNLEVIEKDYCSKKEKEALTYTAEDNYDGDITDKVTKTEEENNYNLKVSDSSGNETIKSIPITYTDKPEGEDLYITGYTNMYIPINSKYTDSGAIVKDGCGQNTNELVTQTGSVDTSKIGTYEITYTSQTNNYKKTRKVTVYNPNVKVSDAKDTSKVIYLTFDDGPGIYTKRVLETLDKYGVKATFFVTHQFNAYVPLIKDEFEKGHSVGVHTYTHKWDVYKSVDAYVDDFNKMNSDIEKYTGAKSKIFRFPGGASNTISRGYGSGIVSAIASRMTDDGYVYFDWNVDSNDAGGGSETQIYNNVVNGVKRCTSCVVLMHDIQKNTVNQLDNILKTLTSEGYKFGTLSENSPTCHHRINN